MEPSPSPDSVPPPHGEEDLMLRAQMLAGRTVASLARQCGRPVPPDLRHAKGFFGTLLEKALGATAGCRAVPDFEDLGIELKSLPVNARGQPLETTFVCTIALLDIGRIEWEDSRLRHKLQRVLWVPVEGTRSLPVGERRIGTPLLWSPNEQEEAELRFDWEELSGIIGRGEVANITGHLGKYLQIRPKARNSQARRQAVGHADEPMATLPRGFYLRTQFTARILRRAFVLPSDSY